MVLKDVISDVWFMVEMYMGHHFSFTMEMVGYSFAVKREDLCVSYPIESLGLILHF